MAAYSGLPPWRRQSKKADAKAGWQWNVGIAYTPKDKRPYVTGGWSVITPDTYTKNPTKPEMVEIHLYNGRKSYVPIGDVDEMAGMWQLDMKDITGEMASYMQAAWEKEEGRGRYYKCRGRGHISGMRYNPTYQLLEVTFETNGATVTFFRVPRELFTEFEMHAISGDKSLGWDGSQRHLLGIRFWDLVRIRGSRVGSRYQFTYTSGGSNAPSYGSNWTPPGASNAQQQEDAAREATVTNKEEPSAAERKKEADEAFEADIKSKMDTNQYTKENRDLILRKRIMLEEKYGENGPEAAEYRMAILKGLWAVQEVVRKYKLW